MNTLQINTNSGINASCIQEQKSLQAKSQLSASSTSGRKRGVSNKLRAAGEEIASWFLLVSVVTALIQLFSHLL
jgi:hypothetical protein